MQKSTRGLGRLGRLASAVAPKVSVDCGKYSLSNFFESYANRNALGVMRGILASGQAYRDRTSHFFVYGDESCGKSHLLRGLCSDFDRAYPEKKVVYMTGEKFYKSYLESYRENEVPSFRSTFFGVDLLVIDGVPKCHSGVLEAYRSAIMIVLANESGGTVVLSDRKHPNSLNLGEAGDVAQFILTGRVLRMYAPDETVRAHIFRRMLKQSKLELGEESVAWIAERAMSVADLESSLALLTEYNAKCGEIPNHHGIPVLLCELNEKFNKPLDPLAIKRAVQDHLDLMPSDTEAGSRRAAVVLARRLMMYLFRKHFELTFEGIGKRFGAAHSAVIEAWNSINGDVNNRRVVDIRNQEYWEMPNLVRSIEEQCRRFILPNVSR